MLGTCYSRYRSIFVFTAIVFLLLVCRCRQIGVGHLLGWDTVWPVLCEICFFLQSRKLYSAGVVFTNCDITPMWHPVISCFMYFMWICRLPPDVHIHFSHMVPQRLLWWNENIFYCRHPFVSLVLRLLSLWFIEM